MSSSNDQEEAGAGEAAEGKEPGYLPILETLRHFWLEFAAKAELRDFNVGRIIREILNALELEAVGHISLRIARKQREEDMALLGQIREDGARG